MSDREPDNILTVRILQCLVSEPRLGANYFVVTKLMQSNEHGAETSQKQRTDISLNSHSNPQFIKNKMHFGKFDISMQCRNTIEFTLFMAPDKIDNDENIQSDNLIQDSIYLGTATLVISQNFLEILKQDNVDQIDGIVQNKTLQYSSITRTLPIVKHQTITQTDVNSLADGDAGSIVVDFKLQINDLSDQFALGNNQIKKYYYDPFVTEESVVQMNLKKIEEMTAYKIPELNEIYNSIDQRQKVLKDLAIDVVEARREIDEKNKRKEKLAAELKSLQKVEEIHIEIDVLQTTP